LTDETLFAQANELIDKNEGEAAFKLISPLVAQNNPRALNSFGYMYENGVYFQQNLKTAFDYYSSAAELGELRAVYNIGRMYSSGIHVKQDFQKAVEYYRKASDGGFKFAQYILGRAYYYGEGVEQDFREAFSLSSLAADKIEEAVYFAGMMLIYGKGIGEDFEKGLELLRLAANRKSESAKTFLTAFESNNYSSLHFDKVRYISSNKSEPYIKLQDAIQNGNHLEDAVFSFVNQHKGENLNHRAAHLAEYLLILSLAEYLYHEAPPDEQNLFMMAELLDAAQPPSLGHKSDLDRLFDMLKEKNQKHMAVHHYHDFKALAGDAEGDIAYSARVRLDIIGDTSNIFSYMHEQIDCVLMAKLIVSTFQKPADALEEQAEINSLTDILISLFARHGSGELISISILNKTVAKQASLKKIIQAYSNFYSEFDKPEAAEADGEDWGNAGKNSADRISETYAIGSDFITFKSADGAKAECEVMGVFDFEGREYIALLSVEDFDDHYMFRYVEISDDEFKLIDIKDDDEFNRVTAEFEKLFDEAMTEGENT